MAIEGIDNIGVAVTDLDRVSDFFSKTLGLDVSKDETARSASVTVGDRYLYIFESTGEVAPTRRDATLTANSPGIDHISLKVADVDAEVQRLGKAGVAFEGEPETIDDWGIRLVRFLDPEGNAYYLVQTL